jgi:hypothetical protein
MRFIFESIALAFSKSNDRPILPTAEVNSTRRGETPHPKQEDGCGVVAELENGAPFRKTA